MARGNLLTLTLALAVSCALGARILGSEKCTWGPSYWCSGLQQSAGCKATNHCIQTVWSSNPYEVDDDDVCTICKNMVAQARDQLESNETQTELKEVFEGSCKLIPIKLIAHECIKLADEFVPELVETLASEMNPDTVCSVAGLCNSKRIDKLLSKFYRQHPPTNCDKCKSETRKISFKVRQMKKDELVDKMLELCGYLSSYSDACKSTVLDNFELLYSLLTHLDDGICELLSACGEGLGNEVVQLTGDDIECQFCTKVIKHWIDTWTANTTEAEFKQVLEALCHKMHGDREARCLHIVDDYYIPLFNYLAHQLDPRGVCAMFGLCGDGEFLQIPDEVSITTLLASEGVQEPEIEITGNEEQGSETTTEDSHVLVGGYFAPQSVLEISKPGCTICEYFMHTLQEMLKDKKTREDIENALDNVCKAMPDSLKDQCTNIVDTYGKAVIELLASDVDPKVVCKMLELCGPEATLFESQPMAPSIKELKTKNENCAMCEYALNSLFEILKSKDDQEMIRNALETVCSHMPSYIADKCENFVHNNIEKIIDMVIENLTPDEICAAIKMCASKKPVQSEACVLCEYAIQTLDSILEDKTNRESVKQSLDKLCSILPQSVSKQCVQFVDTYSDMIIEFIVQGLTPDEVCKQLHLCKESNLLLAQDEMLLEVDLMALEAQESRTEKPYCLLCEYAISEVDKLLEDKQNEEEIKSVLDRICYELSTPIQHQCVKMINMYLDDIIDMFIKEYTPEQVCAELKLCPPKEVTVHSEMNEVATQTQVQSGPMCVMCEFAMSILEKKILTNSSMDMVERSVLMLCSYMPGTLADQCEDFVSKYGDKIIELIVQLEMNPEQVCAELLLCSQRDGWDATPVGGRPCAWGPAFWCQSLIHAQACGTINHCKAQGITFD